MYILLKRTIQKPLHFEGFLNVSELERCSIIYLHCGESRSTTDLSVRE